MRQHASLINSIIVILISGRNLCTKSLKKVVPKSFTVNGAGQECAPLSSCFSCGGLFTAINSIISSNSLASTSLVSTCPHPSTRQCQLQPPQAAADFVCTGLYHKKKPMITDDVRLPTTSACTFALLHQVTLIVAFWVFNKQRLAINLF